MEWSQPQVNDDRAFPVLTHQRARGQAAHPRHHRDTRPLLHAYGQALPAGRPGNDGRVRGQSEVRRRVVRAHAQAGRSRS